MNFTRDCRSLTTAPSPYRNYHPSTSVYTSVTIQIRTFKFVLIAVIFVLAMAPLYAVSQSGSFVISQHGHAVGTATVNFTGSTNGYDTSTVVKVTMQGLNYSFSKTEQLTSANAIKHVDLNATVNNSAVTLTAVPDSAQLLLNISANGKSTTTRLVNHPAAVFFPDFDPGAFDTVLALAVANNNRGLYAVIPKGAGSVSPIQLATYADELGTLDGKPVLVHHLKATIAGSTSDIFSGPQNQLLQAELSQQGFALVRKGFILTPPAKAGAPPAAPAQQTPLPALAAPKPVQQ
ncbi:MAG: hypothetical protein WBQ94_24275 [Terracidiphilus sp.]